ncbi:MAG TPA: hypothetical protein PKD20_02370 [Candidatus Saccharibacteria bacterium]|jgi:hypothetical protein|nr:hypothetical protein [Candidatus Saccharibacteria bacterium]HMT55700.1 hypothetical protein [Candidatus Saccharibacteria bacterium]
MLKIPKHYFQDRSVLGLIGADLALFILSTLNVLLNVNPNENAMSIVAYRDTTKIGQIPGATTDLYQFALFAGIVTFGSIILSMKLYAHRKHLAIGILGLCSLLLVMDIIIFNALTRTL